MTLEEKGAQMVCLWRQEAEEQASADGDFDFHKAKAAFKKGYAPGRVGGPHDASSGRKVRRLAELTNAIWKFFIENTPRGIPVVFHKEYLFRHAAIEGTSFPQGVAPGPRASILAVTTALDQRSQK
jgi:beta-glucosidase